MEHSFDDDARLTLQAPHVIHEAIDGEVVVINLATGTYYSLRGSAAEAWELIQRPDGVVLGQLVATLAARFDAPPSDLRAALEPFLADLGEEGLVSWANDAASSGTGVELVAASNGHADPAGGFEPPRLEKFTDMQELVLLDPVHEVGESGWPHGRPSDAAHDAAA
jgi:hypothetical protein